MAGVHFTNREVLASLRRETVLRELQHTVRAVFGPRVGSWRVTVTLPVVIRTRAVLFLVTGEQKAAIIGKILASTPSRENLPAALARPDSGTLMRILAAEAASEFPSERSFTPDTTVS